MENNRIIYDMKIQYSLKFTFLPQKQCPVAMETQVTSHYNDAMIKLHLKIHFVQNLVKISGGRASLILIENDSLHLTFCLICKRVI
jgi:hypothetical protein